MLLQINVEISIDVLKTYFVYLNWNQIELHTTILLECYLIFRQNMMLTESSNPDAWMLLDFPPSFYHI